MVQIQAGGQLSVIIYYMEISPFEGVIKSIIFLGYIIFWGASFAIIYHLTRFGVGVQPKRFAAAFMLGAILLFSVSLFLFFRLDLNTLLP